MGCSRLVVCLVWCVRLGRTHVPICLPDCLWLIPCPFTGNQLWPHQDADARGESRREERWVACGAPRRRFHRVYSHGIRRFGIARTGRLFGMLKGAG